MEQVIKNIILIICGLIIGASIASSYYSKQLSEQYIEGLEQDVKTSDMHMKHIAGIYLGLLKASEEGNDAILRESYYGFGILSDRLNDKDIAIHQTNFIAFLTNDCGNNVYKSCTYLGEHYFKQKQYSEALPILLKSAEQNNPAAISLLVDLYRVKDWPQANEEIARSWMLKLGKNG
jgi:hypothetical protein